MESTTASETLEQIQARHRKELKELQGRITNKKKNATKKTRKGVNDECERLERDLKDKQASEIAALNGDTNGADEEQESEEEDQAEKEVNGVADTLASTTLSSKPGPEAESAPTKQKSRNRQKERLARRAAEAEAAAEQAAAEAASMPDKREVERGRMEAAFKQHDLVEHQIAPDGHCLFSAVADQLSLLGVSPTQEQDGSAATSKNSEGEAARERAYKAVRRRAAAWMEEHPDDFAPFLEEGLDGYVAKIRDTAEWGGQLELAALASAYDVRIRVVQDGRTEVIEPSGNGGEGGKGKDREAWLAYYRHGFGLGEHYNSLRKGDGGKVTS